MVKGADKTQNNQCRPDVRGEEWLDCFYEEKLRKHVFEAAGGNNASPAVTEANNKLLDIFSDSDHIVYIKKLKNGYEYVHTFKPWRGSGYKSNIPPLGNDAPFDISVIETDKGVTFAENLPNDKALNLPEETILFEFDPDDPIPIIGNYIVFDLPDRERVTDISPIKGQPYSKIHMGPSKDEESNFSLTHLFESAHFLVIPINRDGQETPYTLRGKLSGLRQTQVQRALNTFETEQQMAQSVGQASAPSLLARQRFIWDSEVSQVSPEPWAYNVALILAPIPPPEPVQVMMAGAIQTAEPAAKPDVIKRSSKQAPPPIIQLLVDVSAYTSATDTMLQIARLLGDIYNQHPNAQVGIALFGKSPNHSEITVLVNPTPIYSPEQRASLVRALLQKNQFFGTYQYDIFEYREPTDDYVSTAMFDAADLFRPQRNQDQDKNFIAEPPYQQLILVTSRGRIEGYFGQKRPGIRYHENGEPDRIAYFFSPDSFNHSFEYLQKANLNPALIMTKDEDPIPRDIAELLITDYIKGDWESLKAFCSLHQDKPKWLLFASQLLAEFREGELIALDYLIWLKDNQDEAVANEAQKALKVLVVRIQNQIKDPIATL